MSDFPDFLDIQSKTPWGRTLAEFGVWCQPRAGSWLLDAGTGPGLFPARMAQSGCRAVGVDTDFSLLASGFFPIMARAAIERLPFPSATFDLVTATNVIFLLGDPLAALRECRRVLRADGQVCLLNPSEHLNVASATALADARGLEGRNRESLLGWARRAEKHGGWTEEYAAKLLARAGLRVTETVLRVGPGFARFTRAIKV